ncbi:MAG: efflux RND transporter periplasmic adaptor subunit [Elusimicrobia bacterium]|nr:efflux RND transporter periplasmic adaptor subunit [Elusimicrobiota bacterium]
MRIPSWKTILIAAAVLLGALRLYRSHQRSQELAALDAVDAETFVVRTEKAEVRDIEEKIVLSGSVKALEEAVLYPRVSGKLRKNLLTEGQVVARDQAVALVERDEPGVVFEPAPVPSTINGVVGRTYLDPGANVTPQTPVAMVVNQSQVRVKVDLPERYLGRISSGQTGHVTVEAYPGRSYKGRIFKISPVVDSASRSVLVEFLAENADRSLKSGMFAQVELVIGKRSNALSVSADAVQVVERASLQPAEKAPAGAAAQAAGGRAEVVFLAEGGRAQARPVSVGIKTPEFAEILSGIKKGQEVINFGLYGLKDGSKIEVVQ